MSCKNESLPQQMGSGLLTVHWRVKHWRFIIEIVDGNINGGMRADKWYCAIVSHSEIEIIINTPLFMIKLNTADTGEKAEV